MKKKILLILLLLIMPIFMLCGCDFGEVGKEFIIGNIILVRVEKGDGFDLLVDKSTKVIYIYGNTAYECGITAMLNADGTPMLWEGDL